MVTDWTIANYLIIFGVGQVWVATSVKIGTVL